MSATMEVAPLTRPANGQKSDTASAISDVTLSPLPNGFFHSTFFKRSSFPARYIKQNGSNRQER